MRFLGASQSVPGLAQKIDSVFCFGHVSTARVRGIYCNLLVSAPAGERRLREGRLHGGRALVSRRACRRRVAPQGPL